MRGLILTPLLILAICVTARSSLAAPATVNISSSALATANSSQRKTFFDTENEVHWAFYYNGTSIEYSYSADGLTWTPAGTLAYNTSSFSVAFRNIDANAYVFLVTEGSTYDIVLRRGILTATSVTFDAAQTVFDGTAVLDRYFKPTIAFDGSNNVWVSALHGNTGYQARARRSTNVGDGDLSTWLAASVFGKYSDFTANAVVLEQTGSSMFLLTSSDQGNIFGYKFDGTTWSTANEGGESSWISFGAGTVVGGILRIVGGKHLYRRKLYQRW